MPRVGSHGPPRAAPARMAALTLAGFCAAAAVGRFLLSTTVSQSWLPPRFTAGRAAGGEEGRRVGAGGSGGGSGGCKGSRRQPLSARALHAGRCKAPAEGDRAAWRRERPMDGGAPCASTCSVPDRCRATSGQLHCSLVMAVAAGDAERSQNFLAIGSGLGAGCKAGRGCGQPASGSVRPESGAASHAPDAHSRRGQRLQGPCSAFPRPCRPILYHPAERSAPETPSARRTTQKLPSDRPTAPDQAAMDLTVQFGKDHRRLELPAANGGSGAAAAPTCADLAAALAAEFGVAPHTIKLLVPGGKGLLRLEEQGAAPLEQAGEQAAPTAAGRRCSICGGGRRGQGQECQPPVALSSQPHPGIHSGAQLKMMASAAAAVEAVRRQRDDALTRGFEGELRRELQRSGAGGGGPRLPPGPYTFQRFEAWQQPGLAPPPAEALKLLHRCGAQPRLCALLLSLWIRCAAEASLCWIVRWPQWTGTLMEHQVLLCPAHPAGWQPTLASSAL